MLKRFVLGGFKMDISFKIIEDVTEAANQLVTTFGNLGNLFVGVLKNGVAGYEWLQAGSVLRRLNKLSVTLTFLSLRQRAFFVPSVMTFLKDPNCENWCEVQSNIRTTINICDELLETLQDTRLGIASKNFFANLVLCVMQRQRSLREFLKMPQPSTPEELKALKDYIDGYPVLLDAFDRANAALNAFLDARGVKSPALTAPESAKTAA
jgi:hypothetical protein